MKTKEELNAIKEEVETLNRKLTELSEDELRLVIGGNEVEFFFNNQSGDKELHLYEGTVERDFKPKF